jgi:hypothetical protein
MSNNYALVYNRVHDEHSNGSRIFPFGRNKYQDIAVMRSGGKTQARLPYSRQSENVIARPIG